MLHDFGLLRELSGKEKILKERRKLVPVGNMICIVPVSNEERFNPINKNSSLKEKYYNNKEIVARDTRKMGR